MTIAIVVPALNEEKALRALKANLDALFPQPDERILVDGGSTDETASLAEDLGFKVVMVTPPGRARQINAGVEAARSDLICILHADTVLPADACTIMHQTMRDQQTALAGFTAILRGPEKTRWVTTAHNWLKTWYAPLMFRPHLFIRGCRLLFGDHAMFFRKRDFERIGGLDDGMKVMEDADLCVKMVEVGRVRLINQTVETSDRRVAAWGGLKANWIYFSVGIRWGLGMRKRLGESYPDVR